MRPGRCAGLLLGLVLLAPPVLTGAAGVTSAAGLEGMTIHDASGQELGKIEALLVDLSQGRIGYLLVAPAGGREAGLIVPWGAVRIAPDRREITVRAAADQVRLSPFTRQDLGDRQAEAEVHRYFGVAPYWEENPQTTSAAPGAPGAPKAPSAPGGLRIVPQQH